ncbi:hypothetical protein F5Y16DRAFT_286033 [Xylariaceae sp. FL0255]|nr:hypothetical protein F5Y16DRAFT_286033 [Xylariaceae sp. FL0255]
MERTVIRSALRGQTTIAQTVRMSRSMALYNHQHLRYQSSSPTVFSGSFWKSLVPKPFRPKPKSTVDWGVPDYAPDMKKKKRKAKDWNPATFFIVIFLFIGSMSINMIALKKDYAAFTRRAEVRIGLLREVVEKLQRGEEVDVEKALGSGDPEKEAEWEEVLREIEQDESIKNAKKTIKAREEVAESRPEPQSPPSPGSPKPKPTNYSSFF